MSIIGVTVGTPTSPKRIENEIKPVKTVNNQPPDDDGNVNVVGNNGADGKDGKDGVDGVSPTISVSPITGGHRITITDKNGTKNVDVMDGADGEDGKDGSNGTNGKDGTNGTNGKDGVDGKDGANGKDGVSVTHSWNGTTLTISSASGTSSANLKGDKGDKGDNGETGAAGADGKDGTSVTVTNVSESTADGGSNTVTFSDGKTLTVKNGSKGSKGDAFTYEDFTAEQLEALKGEGVTITEVHTDGMYQGKPSSVIIFNDGTNLIVPHGTDGARGTGILKVSTSPTSYTTATAGINPIKRMSLATIKSEAGVSEVLVGDCIAHSYYLYHIYYLDATYAYMDKSQSIRGATGASGASGTNGADGVGISKIEKTSTSGLVDTYTITFTNSTTSTFTVTNGKDGGNDVPSAVVEGAAATVKKALTRAKGKVLRFLAFSDAHQDNSNTLITKGNKELGMAIGEITNSIGVDFISNFGDSAWGSDADTPDEVKAQIIQLNQFINPYMKGEQRLFLEGNHDDANYNTLDNKISSAEIYSLIYAKNKGVVYDDAHWVDGYCYKDFDHLKVRVICLNTEQGVEDGGIMEGYQLKWLAEKALDMSGKRDWSVMTIAHHPYGYGWVSLVIDAVAIIEAFVSGANLSNYTTRDGTAISIDYSDKNCEYIAHFHGHAHAYSVVPLQKYVSDTNRPDITVNGRTIFEIGIPNACYTRSNQYRAYPNEYRYRYSTETTYDKSDTDGLRTSLNLVTIDLENKVIYADYYGVGIDREIQYAETTISYTNLVETAEEMNSEAVYNGVGYKNGYRLSSSSPFESTSGATGYVLTGYIPFSAANLDPIYIKGAEFVSGTGSYCRMYLFKDKNTLHTILPDATLSNNTQNNFNVLFDIEQLGDKYYKFTRKQLNGYDAIQYYDGGTAKYMRWSLKGSGEDLIISLGKPIE